MQNYTEGPIIAISASNQQQWLFDLPNQTDGGIFCALAIGSNGTLRAVDKSDGLFSISNKGKEHWTLTSYSPAIADGEYQLTITGAGTYSWDVNLSQSRLKAEQGVAYSVSFDARASSEREITAFVGINSEPWTVYMGEGVLSLSTRRQTFTHHFTMENSTDTNIRIGFDMGSDTGKVILDNVFLSNGGGVTQQLIP
ncbi:MAG: carbohydrate binding domain-containing protein [Bacteroidales bacterium]|nr:carbohydrate binding domain-containing protein [Bacteroidales bacterium]